MAEFLVVYKPKDAHPESGADKFRYKKGDVVGIYEDGTLTESVHSDSIFIIIKSPNLAVSGVQKYIEGRFEGPVDGDGFASVSERRKFNIDFGQVPQKIITKLNKTQEAEITSITIRQYIKDKKTGNYET